MKAVAVAVAALLVIEIGVARSPGLWRRVPDSMVGAFNGIEGNVIATAPPPAVVFVGSSRVRDAVEPRQLEASLGLERGGVLNLGLTGGTPYEALLFYERHRTLLRNARLLVVGVEEWYWNDGFPPDDVERMNADFGTRLEWGRRRKQLGDIVGFAWRTVELQDTLPKWGASFVRGVPRLRFVEDRLIWRQPSAILEVGPATTDVDGAVDQLMQSYAPGPTYEKPLGALLRMAGEDGVSVLITQVPQRAAYVDALERRFPDARPYMRRAVDRLAKDTGAKVVLFERGTDLEIPDDRYYDYGHLTEDGCRRMNSHWAALVAASWR